MQPTKVTERIKAKAFELLEQHPEGLRYSELHAKILETDGTFNPNTINGCIWNLDAAYPDKVYKPSKGLFRLLKSKPLETEVQTPPPSSTVAASKVKEEDFYAPFADWLKNEIEDVTHAIPLGGNKFKDKWGTPDVIGKRESMRSDIIKGPTEIVSAEIKTETLQLVTAFGQACAYKIFSHRVYLVVPRQAQKEEISRLDSLCQIFGIGLVIFNADNPVTPDFRIHVRPARHEPDLFYTNKNMALIEKELFSSFAMCTGLASKRENNMKIKPGPVSWRTPVYEVQAHYLAAAIRQLAEACTRQFRAGAELSLEDFYRFSGMPEYEHFIQSAIVCGFVCTDYSRFFPFDKVHDQPNEIVPTLPFSKVRHYIHTLQRAEKWNHEYSTALWTAITSGALLLVARRLESDQSLYESDTDCVEDEI